MLAGGEPLIIVNLARELDLSPTPVREALQRLAGEGLVEERRGRGYFSRRIDVTDIAELYDLSSLLVGAAVETLQARGTTGGEHLIRGVEMAKQPDVQEAVAASEQLFGRLVRATGSRAMINCYMGVAGRLGPARRLEHQVLIDAESEVARMLNLARACAWKELASAVAAFHERRRAEARAIVATARR
jgi:DNA-binding GntR family transcriptional regulator